MLLLRFYRVEK